MYISKVYSGKIPNFNKNILRRISKVERFFSKGLKNCCLVLRWKKLFWRKFSKRQVGLNFYSLKKISKVSPHNLNIKADSKRLPTFMSFTSKNSCRKSLWEILLLVTPQDPHTLFFRQKTSFKSRQHKTVFSSRFFPSPEFRKLEVTSIFFKIQAWSYL